MVLPVTPLKMLAELKNIYQHSLNGELYLEFQGRETILFFEGGNLVFAKSIMPEHRLGEILYKNKKIPKQQYEEIMQLPAPTSERIGKTLVSRGIINKHDLFWALETQIKTIALSIFEFFPEKWHFIEKDSSTIPDNLKIKFNVSSILIHAIDMIDRLPEFENDHQHDFYKMKRISKGISNYFSERQMNFFTRLSKLHEISFYEIQTALNYDTTFFWKHVALFYFLDLLEFCPNPGHREQIELAEADTSDTIISITQSEEDSPTVETEPVPAMEKPDTVSSELEREITYLADMLKEEKLNCYHLLGIKETADAEQIKNAYFELAKRFHPDRIGSNSVSNELVEKSNFVFSEINKAYDILSDAVKRYDYDNQGVQKNKDQAQNREESLKKARILYKNAHQLLLEKNPQKAIDLMNEVLKIDSSKAAYFLLLGKCQSMIPSLKAEAEKNFIKANTMNPADAEPIYLIGLLYEHTMPEKALHSFNHALSIDPTHQASKQKIEDIKKLYGKKKSIFSLFGKK